MIANKEYYQSNPAIAHILYLTNITILPVASFLILIYLYNKVYNSGNKLEISHYRQSILANIVAGLLLVLVSGFILFYGSYDSPYTWIWLILYFTCIHSVLILFGVFALIKANAKQNYIYPVFGKLWC